MEDTLKLKGIFIIERIKNGKVLDREIVENTIVNTGKERVAKLLNDVSSTHFRAIGIGEGTTGALATDSALETERKRATASLSYEADYKAKFEHTFTFNSGESYAITEAGVFDSAVVSGSTMLNRATFSAKNVDVDVSLKVNVKITVS